MTHDRMNGFCFVETFVTFHDVFRVRRHTFQQCPLPAPLLKALSAIQRIRLHSKIQNALTPLWSRNIYWMESNLIYKYLISEDKISDHDDSETYSPPTDKKKKGLYTRTTNRWPTLICDTESSCLSCGRGLSCRSRAPSHLKTVEVKR